MLNLFITKNKENQASKLKMPKLYSMFREDFLKMLFLNFRQVFRVG